MIHLFTLPARLRWLALTLLFSAVLVSCKRRDTDEPLSPDAARAEIARLKKHLERHPDDRDAWRDLGHLHWLHVNETDQAVPIFDRLARAGDPVAQFSRTVIAHGRLDADGVWENSTKLIEAAARKGGSAADRRFLAALAEPAARFLDDVQGDRPGDDEAFIKFFEGLNLESLPVEVSQPLLSTRAAIARRLGQDYRSYYETQGCVREWVAGPIEGHLGELELSRRDEDREGFTQDETAQLAALSCVVRIWNPEPRSGIRRLRAVLEPTGKSINLDVAAQNPVRVYLDGELVHRTDLVDRWPSRHTILPLTVAPGPHVLELRTAIPEDRAWILVRATDEDGRAVPTAAAPNANVSDPYKLPRKGLARRAIPWPDPMGDITGSIYLPLRAYLAIDDALADGDTDRAERSATELAAMGMGFPEGHLILADFEEGDPTRGRNASASRRQSSLEDALALDPKIDRALLQLLDHRLGQGEEAEIIEELKRLRPEQLDTTNGHLLRWRAYLERGSDYLAEKALARAIERDPESCDVLLARRRMARRLSQVKLEDEIVAKLDKCAGTIKLRSRLARERGDTAQASELLDKQIDRVPDDLDALEAMASVAITERRFDDAIALYEQVLSYAPFRATAHVNIADVLAQAGNATRARTYVRQAIEMLPHNGRLREIGETIGIEDPLMKRRTSGAEALESYKRAGQTYEGVREVLVLDRDVAEVYASGGQRHIVHQVAHLLSKEALDQYGEIVLPGGSRVLTLQSIKPDGTVVEPELIPGKDGLSLRNLEIGDFVEMEYVIERDPVTILPGHVDLSRFRFQSLETPYHWSELIVVAPKDMGVKIESRNGAPRVERTEEYDKQILRFLARQMARRPSEPNARSMLDELPTVRVFTELEVEAWLESIALQMRPAQRSNPELRDLTRDVAGDMPGEFAKVEAIYDWVMENVEEGGDLSTHATRTLAAREGNRLMLLRAMIREAGLRSEVWLARDAFGPTIKTKGHPMVEVYDAPVLAVWVDEHETPLILSTIAKSLPPGYLLPAHSGTDALRVRLAQSERAPGPVRLPMTPKRLADRRSYDLRFALDERGNGSLTGTIELQGMEALLWRSVLQNVDVDQRGERFQEGELAVIARGAGLDLETLEIDNEDQLDAPLVLRFTASATGVGVAQGGALVVPAAVVPMNLGLGYTQLPERWSGMVVPYAPVQEARVTLEFAGGRIEALPEAKQLETKFGSYTRQVTEGTAGGSSLVMETRATLSKGIVEAEDYAKMGQFTRAIQTAEQDVLRIK